MKAIVDCFTDEGIPIDIEEITYDPHTDDYRIQIYKHNLPLNNDWSTQFSKLDNWGFKVTGITSDRYEDYIYIWIESSK